MAENIDEAINSLVLFIYLFLFDLFKGFETKELQLIRGEYMGNVQKFCTRRFFYKKILSVD